MTDTPKSNPLITWGQLVRLPNVFTVLADVGAGYLVIAQGPASPTQFITVLIAGVMLYWSGMILNDVFDVEVDKQQRSNRPLAAGRIAVPTAKFAGFALLIGGVATAALTGYLNPADQAGVNQANWTPALVAGLLAGCILIYDGPIKRTPAAPVAMGGCRVLSFLLGASLFLPALQETPLWLSMIAVGMGVYVMGVTLAGRHEADPNADLSTNLKVASLVIAVGGAMVALGPSRADRQWAFPPGPPFGFLVAMIVMPVVLRVWRASMKPSPQLIQVAVRSGVLTIIPLSAAVAFLGAGPFWGLLVFAGVVPALSLSRHFRVT